MNNQEIVIIDGDYVIHSNLHISRQMVDKSNNPDSNLSYVTLYNVYRSIYSRMAYALGKDILPILLFDSRGSSNSKKEIFEDYKGNRNHNDETLSVLSYVKSEMTKLFELAGYLVLHLPFTEADDTARVLAETMNTTGVLISNDGDWELSLINPNLGREFYYYKIGNKDNKPTRFEDVYLHSGLQEIADTYNKDVKYIYALRKAIIGDPSDNIPGIKGIGWKSANNAIHKLLDVNTHFDQTDDVIKWASIIYDESLLHGSDRCSAIQSMILDKLSSRNEKVASYSTISKITLDNHFYNLVKEINAKSLQRKLLVPYTKHVNLRVLNES